MSRKKSVEARASRRDAARLSAVQALYQMEAAGQAAEDVVAEFLAHRIGAEDGANGGGGADADPDLFRRLVGAAVNWQARIDQATDRALVAAWPLNRIDPVLRAIFRAAGAELVLAETPPRAVLGGFVDIARWFCGEGPETGFVNAVLEHMARDMAPDAFASA